MNSKIILDSKTKAGPSNNAKINKVYESRTTTTTMTTKHNELNINCYIRDNINTVSKERIKKKGRGKEEEEEEERIKNQEKLKRGRDDKVNSKMNETVNFSISDTAVLPQSLCVFVCLCSTCSVCPTMISLFSLSVSVFINSIDSPGLPNNE